MEVVKIACRRKWQLILLEKWILEPKENAKDERWKSWDHLKKIEFERIIWEMGGREIICKSKTRMKKWEMTRDSSGHA